MNFTALLFCQDEKTARVTTQLLTELEFSVETSTEPFAAVKKLMAQHFDAVVVDCDNEQNASLLFKGARNSQLNQSSLAVAVVEGQAGVANAFRIGANLVLTKPINVEQAKGTLRVARGLLKKGGESAKASAPAPAATPAAAPTAAPAPAVTPPTLAAAAPSPIPPAPAVAKPVISAAPTKAMAAPVMAKASTDNILDLDSDTAAVAEENLLDLDEPKPSARPELKTSLSPSSLLDAEQAAAKPAAPKRPPTAPVISSGGAASAPAPARMPAHVPEFEKVGEPARKPQPAAAAASSQAPMEAPGLFSQRSSAPTFGGLDAAEPEFSGGAAKYAMIAVAVIALAAAGYFGYTKFHKQAPVSEAEQTTAQPATATPADVMPSAVVTAEPPAKPKASILEKLAPEVSASTSHKSDALKPAESEPEVVVKNFEPEARVVKANPAAAPKPKAKEKETEAEAPSVIGAAPGDQAAISNIVTSAPVSVPASAPQPEMLRVSQGVTQGLLLKRVQPVYPHAALQMRIGGSVQLQAVISKTGAISSVKLTSGDPILAKAAIEAVKQWKYKPYLLDGDAVEIQTQITVNFKLP